MKISILAKQLGISVSTIRYYEQLGLLKPVKKGYYKQYTEEHKEALELILRLKGIGFTLFQIKELFLADQVETSELSGEEYHKIKQLILNVLEKLKKKEKEILQAKETLNGMLTKLEAIKHENQ